MEENRRRFAGTVKVGERGQIVIPKEIRDLFGIKAGDSLLMLADTGRGIALLQDEDIFSRFRDNLGWGPEGDEHD